MIFTPQTHLFLGMDGQMTLAASNFEFKNRFWIIGAIFWAAFWSYSFDHQNAGVALTDWIARLHGSGATDTGYRWTFAVASLFAVLATLVRTWGTAYLNPQVMVDSNLQTSRLVADGPYPFVRNPLYFGNILLAIGFGMMASRTGCALLIAGMLVFVYRLILREEAGIAATQGDAYRAYVAAVPRLLPTLRARVPSRGGVPNWTDGFLGEAFMWMMAASLVAFTISLQQKLFFWVLGSAFVVYAACYAIIKRRKPADPNRQPTE
jgi:protein-S-isoprenylcysteine O-methyltransferase Ste14